MSSRSGAGLRKADRRVLEQHVSVLLEEHSWLQLESRQTGLARLAGRLPMVLPDGRTEPIGLGVELRALGGRIGAVAFDTDGRWPPDPARHVVTEHQFCLSLRGVDELMVRLPAELLSWMNDVIVFVRQQLILDATPGGFPGPEWPHGEQDAYALHIWERLARLPEASRTRVWDCLRGIDAWPKRNDPCLCRSSRKFKRCCALDDERQLGALARRPNLAVLAYDELEGVAHPDGVG